MKRLSLLAVLSCLILSFTGISIASADNKMVTVHIYNKNCTYIKKAPGYRHKRMHYVPLHIYTNVFNDLFNGGCKKDLSGNRTYDKGTIVVSEGATATISLETTKSCNAKWHFEPLKQMSAPEKPINNEQTLTCQKTGDIFNGCRCE